uniref:BPI2 domain-containing protein n=1 Tax=Parastrongyloides trichosuri TaxID=131310 RepID=A0A0N4ZY39_PARTI
MLTGFTSFYDMIREVADSSATINADFHEDKGPMTFIAKKIEIISIDLTPNPTIKLDIKLKVRVNMLLSLHFGIVNTDNSSVTLTASINKGSINLVTKIIQHNSYPKIKLMKTIVKADEFDFDIEGNFLVSAMGKVLKLFKSKLQKLIENRAKEEFKIYFEKQINDKMKLINVNRSIFNDYKINYHVTGDGFIKEDEKMKLFVMPLHGGLYVKNSLIPLNSVVNNIEMDYGQLSKVINNNIFNKIYYASKYHMEHDSSICYYYHNNLLWRYINLYVKVGLNEKLHLNKSSIFKDGEIITSTSKGKLIRIILTSPSIVIKDDEGMNISVSLSQILLPSTKILKYNNVKLFTTSNFTIICGDVSIQLDCLGLD